MNPEFDIVIVGGGAAGVGAARRLAGSGLSAILIEAGSRLGGRASTQEIRGLELDLGCGWLHSAGRNPWTAIAQRQGLAIDKTPPPWERPSMENAHAAPRRYGSNPANRKNR